MVVSDSEGPSSQSKSPSQPGSAASSGRVQKRTKRQNSQSTAGSTAKNLSSLSAASVQIKSEDASSSTPDLSAPITSPATDKFEYSGTPSSGLVTNAPGSIPAKQPDVTGASVTPQKSCCATVAQPVNPPRSSGGCCSTSKKTSCCEGSDKNTAAQIISDETPHLPPAFMTHYPLSYHYQPHLQNTPFSSSSLSSQATAFSHTQFSESIRPGYNHSGFNPSPSTRFTSPNAAHHYSGLTQPMVSQSYQVGSYNQGFPGMTQDPCHNCGCGDGCQCLGCASHPFNDTTRQHIQEMGYMMAAGASDQGVEGNDSVENPTFNNQNTQSHFQHPNLGYGGLDQSSLTHSLLNHNERQHLVSFPSTPSTVGPVPYESSNEQMMMMRPTAYYTVEYPVSLLDPCTNMMGTCQCGVNCKCVGCLTHNGHNGVALQPSPPPEHPDAAMFNNTDTSHLVPAALQRPMQANPGFGEYSAYPSTSHPPNPPPL